MGPGIKAMIERRLHEDESPYLSMIEAKMKLYSIKQASMTNVEYLQQLTLYRDVTIQHGGRVGCDEGLKEVELHTERVMWNVPLRPQKLVPPRGDDDITPVERNTYLRQLENNINTLNAYEQELTDFDRDIWTITSKKALATLMIHNADKERYVQLQERLRDSFNKGRDEYPRTLNEAMMYLVKEEGANQRRSSHDNCGGRRGGPRGSQFV